MFRYLCLSLLSLLTIIESFASSGGGEYASPDRELFESNPSAYYASHPAVAPMGDYSLSLLPLDVLMNIANQTDMVGRLSLVISCGELNDLNEVFEKYTDVSPGSHALLYYLVGGVFYDTQKRNFLGTALEAMAEQGKVGPIDYFLNQCSDLSRAHIEPDWYSMRIMHDLAKKNKSPALLSLVLNHHIKKNKSLGFYDDEDGIPCTMDDMNLKESSLSPVYVQAIQNGLIVSLPELSNGLNHAIYVSSDLLPLFLAYTDSLFEKVPDEFAYRLEDILEDILGRLLCCQNKEADILEMGKLVLFKPNGDLRWPVGIKCISLKMSLIGCLIEECGVFTDLGEIILHLLTPEDQDIIVKAVVNYSSE
jgi:hypothetical protein